MGLLAMIAALLVWLASYARGYVFGFGHLTGVMKWLGERSYGVYLIHMPVFRISQELAVRYVENLIHSPLIVIFLLLTSVVLILLMADLNYRYVEVPLRRFGAARAKKMLLAEERRGTLTTL